MFRKPNGEIIAAPLVYQENDFQLATNPALKELFRAPESKDEDFVPGRVYIEHNSAQLEMDVRRSIKVNHKFYRGDSNSQKRVEELTKLAEKGNIELSKLDLYHNQELMHLSNSQLSLRLGHHAIFQPENYWADIYNHENSIFFDTTHEDYKIILMIDREPIYLHIPCTTNNYYKLEPENGFILKVITFTNSVVAGWALGDRTEADHDNGRQGDTKADFFNVMIKEAYKQEITNLLKKTNNAIAKKVLSNINLLCNMDEDFLNKEKNKIIYVNYKIAKKIINGHALESSDYEELFDNLQSNNPVAESSKIFLEDPWIRVNLAYLNFSNFVKNNPRKFLAFAGGLVLAAVGIALTMTGVLAPLGAALGWAGLSMAAPSAVAAVGAICFAMPAIIGGLVVGCIKGIKALVAKCFPGPGPGSGEKPSRGRQVLNGNQVGSPEEAKKVHSESGNGLQIAIVPVPMVNNPVLTPSPKTEAVVQDVNEAEKNAAVVINRSNSLKEEKTNEDRIAASPSTNGTP